MLCSIGLCIGAVDAVRYWGAGIALGCALGLLMLCSIGMCIGAVDAVQHWDVEWGCRCCAALGCALNYIKCWSKLHSGAMQ